MHFLVIVVSALGAPVGELNRGVELNENGEMSPSPFFNGKKQSSRQQGLTADRLNVGRIRDSTKISCSETCRKGWMKRRKLCERDLVRCQGSFLSDTGRLISHGNLLVSIL